MEKVFIVGKSKLDLYRFLSIMFVGVLLVNFFAVYKIIDLRNQLDICQNELVNISALNNYNIKVADVAIMKSNELYVERVNNYSKLRNNYKQFRNSMIIHDANFQIAAFLYKYYPNMNSEDRAIFTEAFSKHSIDNNIPPLIMASICKRESNFNPDARGSTLPSGANAKGVCQIHPRFWVTTIQEIGYKTKQDLFIPDANVYAGVKAFQHFYNQRGNIQDALYGYVGGNHTSYTIDVMKMYGDMMIWLYSLDSDNIEDIINSVESENIILAKL